MPANTAGGVPYVLPADHPLEYPAQSQQLALVVEKSANLAVHHASAAADVAAGAGTVVKVTEFTIPSKGIARTMLIVATLVGKGNVGQLLTNRIKIGGALAKEISIVFPDTQYPASITVVHMAAIASGASPTVELHGGGASNASTIVAGSSISAVVF